MASKLLRDCCWQITVSFHHNKCQVSNFKGDAVIYIVADYRKVQTVEMQLKLSENTFKKI